MIVRPSKPVMVLFSVSLCACLLGALPMQLAAQESSSRKVARYAKLPKQELVTRPLITAARQDETQELTQDDELDELLIPGTLMDGSELFRPIMEIELRVIDTAERRPKDLTDDITDIDYRTNYPGSFQDRVAMWCAPNIRYQPLYFEDVGLERYGYHCGDFWQPGVSALHYGASFAMLPVNLFRQPPWRCTYPLGFCRPGSLAPQTKNKWLFWK